MIHSINRDEYFEQYVWALENYDLRAVFMAFLEKERNITDESIKESLYSNFVKNNENEVITDLQLDVLNYVLKLENGVYKKNEVVFNFENEKFNGSFSLAEPGYYLFELDGPSGTCSRKSTNIFIKQSKKQSLFIDTCNNIKLYVFDDLTYCLNIFSNNVYIHYVGHIEINDSFAFFFLDDELESSSSVISSLATTPEKTETLYDYAKIDYDAFSKDFLSLQFIFNKYTLYEENSNNIVYLNKDETSIITPYSRAKQLSEVTGKLKDNASYYKSIIESNYTSKSGKEYIYNNILNKGVPDVFNTNYLHGGDGGHVCAVIYIDKEQTVSYSIGKYTDKTHTKLSFDNIALELKAEAGGTFNCSSLKYDSNDNCFKFKKDVNFSDTSSKNYNSILNFHVGEQIGFNNFDAGCGYGIIDDGSNEPIYFKGGGKLGAGIRLNNFNNAYFQQPENGHIKITYLCSKYSKHTKVLNSYNNDNIQPFIYFYKDIVPIGCNISYKIFTKSFYGGIDISEKNNKIEDFIIKNKNRELNYLSFDIDTSSLSDATDYELSLKYSPENKFIDFEKDDNEFSLISPTDFYDKVLGYDFSYSKIPFKFKFFYSKCYNVSLLCAYNLFSSFDTSHQTSIYIEDFNEHTYNASINIENAKSFKFLNIYDEIIVLSFSYDSIVKLPQVIDHFSNEIFNKTNGYIENIDVSFDNGVNFIRYNNSKVFIPKNSFIYIKLNFNTGRIVFDENASIFSGKLNVYNKNETLMHKNIDYHYFNKYNSENFQYLTFVPDSSQNFKVSIKKYTFSLTIFQDLFGQISLSNLSNKTEFEPGEAVLLSTTLKNYLRISNLTNKFAIADTSTKDQYGINYSIKDSINKFESYFKFGKYPDKCFNIVDPYVLNIFSRSGCTNVKNDFSQNLGINCICSRVINLKNEISNAQDDSSTDANAIKRLNCLESAYDEIRNLKDTSKTSLETNILKIISNYYDSSYDFSSSVDDIFNAYKNAIKSYVVTEEAQTGVSEGSDGEGQIDTTTKTTIYYVFDNSKLKKEDLYDLYGITSENTATILKIKDKSYNFYYDFDVLSNELFKIVCNSLDNLLEENVYIYVYFKEFDIELRLSSNYNCLEKISCVENGSSSYIGLLKNYKFLIYGCGGPTGNGQNGGQGTNTYDNPGLGGFGGDGYSGGAGGGGGSSKRWKPFIGWWSFLPISMGVEGAFGAQGGGGGRGFIESGAVGVKGKNVFHEATSGYYDESTGKNHYDKPKRSPLYVGLPHVFTANITTTGDSPFMYLFSGRQGYTYYSTAGGDTCGAGGGGGLASYIYLKDCYINALTHSPYFSKYVLNFNNLYSSINNTTTSKKGIIFEGGLAGQTYKRSCDDVTGTFTVWESISVCPSQDDFHSCNVMPMMYGKESGQWGQSNPTITYSHPSSYFTFENLCDRFTNEQYGSSWLLNTNKIKYSLDPYLSELVNNSFEESYIIQNDGLNIKLDYTNTDDKNCDDIINNPSYSFKGNSYFSYETGIVSVFPFCEISDKYRTEKEKMSLNDFSSGLYFEKPLDTIMS